MWAPYIFCFADAIAGSFLDNYVKRYGMID